jgi:hypothetical protein
MHWAGQLVFQRGIDPALAFHARNALERCRDQTDMKMGFALAAIVAGGAGMAGMAGTLILDIKRHGRKNRRQLLPHGGGYAHGFEHLPPGAKVKLYVSLSFTLSIP